MFLSHLAAEYYDQEVQNIILRKQKEFIRANPTAFEAFLKKDSEYVKALAEFIGENRHGQNTSP